MAVSTGKPRLILVGGGARSGKSRFALARAGALGSRRTFVATAEPLDEEMAARIRRHRAERGDGWTTIEEPLALPEALDALGPTDVVLVDCLTLWVSNLLVRGGASPSDHAAAAPALAPSAPLVPSAPFAAFAMFDRLEAALDRRRAHVVLVTNEVGMGLVPDTALGRVFRDTIGELHQRLAARADEIYLAALGMVLRLKPSPVEAVTAGVTFSPEREPMIGGSP